MDGRAVSGGGLDRARRLASAIGNRSAAGLLTPPERTLQRQDAGNRSRRELGYVAVGDPQLNYGGGYLVQHLTEVPAALMRISRPNEWTLVLSIHGAQNLVADVGGQVRTGGPDAYDAARVRSIFSTPEFVRWRNANGPTRLVMNACQLSREFEAVFIDVLTRAGAPGGSRGTQQGQQQPQGLGTGCRPSTRMEGIEGVNTRADYDGLSAAERARWLRHFQEINRRWGYFGRPPVPDGQVLHYLFGEPPVGEWPIVEVTSDRRPTGVPFWDRRHHGDFWRLCTGGIAELPSRPVGSAAPILRPARR